jgi:NTP pyrophosphatase (non-canonical NTP hydrolase)
MTHSLEDLIEQSGENAEAKGFHDDGNKLRTVLDLLPDGGEAVLHIDTEDGIKYVALDFDFWKRMYAAYKGNRQFLIVSEVVEALDEVRNDKPSIYEVDGKPEGSAVELADALIRIGDYAWEFKEPVVEAIDTKAAYNAKRERMHGGKLS